MARPAKRGMGTSARVGAYFGAFLIGIALLYILFGPMVFGNAVGFNRAGASATSTSFGSPFKAKVPELDREAYDAKMLAVANLSSTTLALLASTTAPASSKAAIKWPVKNAPYPKVGALLPFNRIVAYYGNFYSKGMGVLGEYPEDVMLEKLRAEVAKWEAADPKTPVVPAIHYIVTTAQMLPQKDGMYTLRMPDDQIDKALAIAEKIDGIVFLDFQVGLSTLQKELPHYEAYLKHPKVHLGIDPEFSMKTGHAPGKVIGSYDAADINFAAQYLAKLVQENDLPPKILVIHRFTQDMVTNSYLIKPLPEVQIVMDMDGWGDKAKKIGTYTRVIVPEPVQFTGFKLFYKNDRFPPSTGMFEPVELMKLSPQPIYIQYQ